MLQTYARTQKTSHSTAMVCLNKNKLTITHKRDNIKQPNTSAITCQISQQQHPTTHGNRREKYIYTKTKKFQRYRKDCKVMPPKVTTTQTARILIVHMSNKTQWKNKTKKHKWCLKTIHRTQQIKHPLTLMRIYENVIRDTEIHAYTGFASHPYCVSPNTLVISQSLSAEQAGKIHSSKTACSKMTYPRHCHTRTSKGDTSLNIHKVMTSHA